MVSKQIWIKDTGIDDFSDVMHVQERAFGTKTEAELTADLLRDPTAAPLLSLLAYDGDRAVGHILFTRVYMNELHARQPMIHILAPLAIIPEYQKQGIGGALIREGVGRLEAIGSEMVFVLGHIGYYDRFGFIRDAKGLGYEAPFQIAEEFRDAWMAQPLNSSNFAIPPGKVVCADALNKEEYWRE